MSEKTLKQLKNQLERNHWVIKEMLPGDDYRISSYWIITRPDNTKQLTIAFNGMDENEVLPLEQAYGFELLEHPEIGAYMGTHITKSWAGDLEQFIQLLNSLDKV